MSIRRRIEAGIPGASAEVEDVGRGPFQHARRRPGLRGLSRVQQHRLVYDLFEDGELGGAIHALSIKTETP